MCGLATQRALLFSLQVQVQTPIIFQPGHIGRILKNCVFVCFVLQLFSFMFLRPPLGCLFPQHTDSSQPVSYNKQHPLCWFWSPFLIIFLVILKRPFQSHSLGHEEMQIQTGREFQASEQNNLLAGQWVLRMEALGYSTYIRLRWHRAKCNR